MNQLWLTFCGSDNKYSGRYGSEVAAALYSIRNLLLYERYLNYYIDEAAMME